MRHGLLLILTTGVASRCNHIHAACHLKSHINAALLVPRCCRNGCQYKQPQLHAPALAWQWHCCSIWKGCKKQVACVSETAAAWQWLMSQGSSAAFGKEHSSRWRTSCCWCHLCKWDGRDDDAHGRCCVCDLTVFGKLVQQVRCSWCDWQVSWAGYASPKAVTAVIKGDDGPSGPQPDEWPPLHMMCNFVCVGTIVAACHMPIMSALLQQHCSL